MGTAIKDGFHFKYSWRKALMDYPAEVRLEVYEAIMEYAESGTLIELKPMAKMAFSIFKVEIDQENDRTRSISEKRAEAGRKAMEVRYNKSNKVQQNLTSLTNVTNASNCYQVLEKTQPNNNIINNNNLDIQEKKETTTKVVVKKKEKDAAKAATLTIEQRQKDFYDTLLPYIGKYPKEMLRKFYNHWSELNKPRTKMRYEMEKTWEVGKRLATWAGRESTFKQSSMEIGTVLHDNAPDKYQNEEKWNR